MTKNNYHIGIGITGGIAGYKLVDLIKSLKNKNINISVIMTANAIKMFGVKMFEDASGQKVYRNIIPEKFDYREVLKDRKVEHISIADSLNLLLIAPATANIIAKTAYGLADDYLTTLALSVTCPVMVAPSMNSNMWNKKVTAENIEKLKALGFILILPDAGLLACGYDGVGRLKNIKEIEEFTLNILNKSQSLKGKKIMVTAGGTYVSVDKVRILTNRASGKMGKYIAEEAFKRGADVLLVRSETSVPADLPVKEVLFRTPVELDAILTKHCGIYDIIFHSASISDFEVKGGLEGKLDSGKVHNLKLKPTKKLIQNIKNLNNNILLVAFKALVNPDKEEVDNAGRNLIKISKADYVIINDVGRGDIGFASDYNEVCIMERGGKVVKLDKNTKKELAVKILDTIIK